MYEGYLISPESIASRAKNELFVSLHNGNIVRVFGNDFEKTEVVANLGPGCAGPWEEHICGRPLGMRFANDKRLLIADSYLGIFALDLKTGKKERLVDPSEAIGGLVPRLIDDLDMDANGDIYWSDASTTGVLADGLVELVSDPSGRLIKYNSATKKNEVLLSNLHFANGVQLSPDHQFVLVSETFKHRVMRYWLNGPKAGSSDVFVSGLPGMPDNIRARQEGGYYISLVTARHPDVMDGFALTSQWPGLRKVFTRATALLQKAVNAINSYFPNHFCKVFSYKMFNLGVVSDWTYHGESIIVEVDEKGVIVGSLQGSNGVVKMVSETQQVGDYLFFGSPYTQFLGRLHISKKKAAPSKPTKQPTKTPQKKEEL
ncbi:UNVERIFIED_CONTAM: hypothetical protein GTU68_063179 [Idotea baltica]|nr:hypothetical protein [Idotea baltica]